MNDNKKKTIDVTGLNRINGDTATMSSEASVSELIEKTNLLCNICAIFSRVLLIRTEKII